MAGERCSSQASATWCGVTPSWAADRGQRGRLQRGESAEREERRVGDVLRCAPVDQGVVGAIRDVVEVLHGHDGRDRLRLGELGLRRRADAEVPDQAVLLQLSQRAEGLADRIGAVAFGGHPKVHHVQRVQAQVIQVLLDLGPEAGRVERRMPAAVLAPARPDLGDDAQVGRIGVQGFPDQLVDHERPVEVTGVDVGDAEIHGGAQHRDGLVAVTGRPEDAAPGELHGTEPHAGDDEVVGQRESSAGNAVSHLHSSRREVPVAGNSAFSGRSIGGPLISRATLGVTDRPRVRAVTGEPLTGHARGGRATRAVTDRPRVRAVTGEPLTSHARAGRATLGVTDRPWVRAVTGEPLTSHARAGRATLGLTP